MKNSQVGIHAKRARSKKFCLSFYAILFLVEYRRHWLAVAAQLIAPVWKSMAADWRNQLRRYGEPTDLI